MLILKQRELTYVNLHSLHLIYLTPEKTDKASVIQQTAAVRNTNLVF